MSDSEQGEGYGGVPQEEGNEREKIITALPEASWWVVWGTRARVASTVALQGACSVRVLSVSPLEVYWND